MTTTNTNVNNVITILERRAETATAEEREESLRVAEQEVLEGKRCKYDYSLNVYTVNGKVHCRECEQRAYNKKNYLMLTDVAKVEVVIAKKENKETAKRKLNLIEVEQGLVELKENGIRIKGTGTNTWLLNENGTMSYRKIRKSDGLYSHSMRAPVAGKLYTVLMDREGTIKRISYIVTGSPKENKKYSVTKALELLKHVYEYVPSSVNQRAGIRSKKNGKIVYQEKTNNGWRSRVKSAGTQFNFSYNNNTDKLTCTIVEKNNGIK